MDFRELNDYMETYTANADVFADKMREWWRQGVNVSMIDLKSAYLQIHVDEALWPYQAVEVKGRRYCLTRLGFGLNVAPLVMKIVLGFVLTQETSVKAGTSAYIDDIQVNEDVVNVSCVEQELEHFGVQCKASERVVDCARVLGLTVWGDYGDLRWRRRRGIGDVAQKLTRRTVFPYCSELVGHLLVYGWLRVGASFAKRRITAATKTWDEPADDDAIRSLLEEITARVRENDPAKGRRQLPGPWHCAGN
uniref:Reverse transcriptase domain-containing protein n=1 Tax=Trichuris muris TaxID=70415 RepID=A0A5S6Q5E2_TRIMR